MDEKRQRPNGVQWLNCWGSDVSPGIGMDRIHRACGAVSGALWQDGVFRSELEPPEAEIKKRLEELLGLHI